MGKRKIVQERIVFLVYIQPKFKPAILLLFQDRVFVYMYKSCSPSSTEMGVSVVNDSMVLKPGPDVPVNVISGQDVVDFVKCDCCGLTEECTPSYIETIRERYGGKWICGLCAEAVKDESLRCQKLISPDEAMARHFSFCNKFRASSPPQDPTLHLIRAIRHVLSRGLESPKFMRSMPSSPTSKRGELDLTGSVLARSESCMPSLTLDEPSVYCGIEECCE